MYSQVVEVRTDGVVVVEVRTDESPSYCFRLSPSLSLSVVVERCKDWERKR
ncbi:hypothetical protein A2U01_0029587 [Trifolium medium]|uniref:Uncharacterized protein n=1 Tax=Trifolium medium TaxID=97028 RepID=A0A392PAP5_9FABA|nr:hypothetical protein [Trifolium medium]